MCYREMRNAIKEKKPRNGSEAIRMKDDVEAHGAAGSKGEDSKTIFQRAFALESCEKSFSLANVENLLLSRTLFIDINDVYRIRLRENGMIYDTDKR